MIRSCLVCLAALAPLTAGNLCSSTTEVAPVQTERDPLPLTVAATLDTWDDWEQAHPFLVVNLSMQPWFLVPCPSNPPMRALAEDAPGLDGSLGVPRRGHVMLCFRSGNQELIQTSRFKLLDAWSNHPGINVQFHSEESGEGDGQDLLKIELSDAAGTPFKDENKLALDPQKGWLLITGDGYR